MRQFARSLACGLAALFALATAALALTNPPTFAPRHFTWQMSHYTRHVCTINASGTGYSCDAGQFTACNFVSSTCSVKIGAFPYNSFLLRGNWEQITACNAATTCTMSLGTASAGAQLVSAQDIKTAATGAPALTIVTAGQGIQALGNGIAQTGTDGGFDLWVTIAFTGAAPTAGQVVFDLEFLAPNDGGCVPVPMGSTSAAC